MVVTIIINTVYGVHTVKILFPCGRDVTIVGTRLLAFHEQPEVGGSRYSYARC